MISKRLQSGYTVSFLLLGLLVMLVDWNAKFKRGGCITSQYGMDWFLNKNDTRRQRYGIVSWKVQYCRLVFTAFYVMETCKLAATLKTTFSNDQLYLELNLKANIWSIIIFKVKAEIKIWRHQAGMWVSAPMAKRHCGSRKSKFTQVLRYRRRRVHGQEWC